MLEPLALALDPVVLVLLAGVFANVDTVEPHGAANVHAIADIPSEVAVHAIEREAARAEDLDHFSFVEHVLLQRDSVPFTLREDFLHEGVEVVGGRAGRGLRRSAGHAQESTQDSAGGSAGK